MKTCFKCGATLLLSEFYRHPKMADGHLNKCKKCTRRDAQVNRALRAEQYRAYDKRRYREDPDRKAFCSTQKSRVPALKRIARVTVTNWVRRGKLVPEPCAVCGDRNVEAHHPDYRRALAVVWLCHLHHGEAHRIDDERRHSVQTVITQLSPSPDS